MNAPPRIALIGFMGSGKSTVGEILAKRLGYRFVDLDARVEQRAGRSVAEIFRVDGEPAFRKRESACLSELTDKSGVVIAAGGGAPLQEANRDFFLSRALTYFLDIPLAAAIDRVGRGDPSRPLMAKDDAALADLYESRIPVYRALGKRIACADKSPREVAEEILALVRQFRG